MSEQSPDAKVKKNSKLGRKIAGAALAGATLFSGGLLAHEATNNNAKSDPTEQESKKKATPPSTAKEAESTAPEAVEPTAPAPVTPVAEAPAPTPNDSAEQAPANSDPVPGVELGPATSVENPAPAGVTLGPATSVEVDENGVPGPIIDRGTGKPIEPQPQSPQQNILPGGE